MAQLLLLLIGALVVGAIVFGIAVLITGGEGLGGVEPDGRSVPLPVARPLAENDLGTVRFDTALRGYRMAQVDHALRRVAYDIGYKTELIQVLEAEVTALREGRVEHADQLRDARRAAMTQTSESNGRPAQPVGDVISSDEGTDGTVPETVAVPEAETATPQESTAADDPTTTATEDPTMVKDPAMAGNPVAADDSTSADPAATDTRPAGAR